MNTDMTKGSPGKLLWKFALPMLLSVVCQQLYSIADSVIAGQYINKNALAAVGASYPITMIFLAIGMGANLGCTVIISQLFGAKQYKDMKTAVFTSIISVIGLGAVLAVLGILTCDLMITLLNTPVEIFGNSSLYLSIYIWGLPFLFLYNICNGIFTALGDSKTPLLFLFISSAGNVVLDLVFVISFQMGVAGVAWATFLCQGVCSAAALIAVLLRIKKVKINGAYTKFSFVMLKTISAIAVPSMLQQSFVSVGNLFIQGLVNSFGPDVIAGYASAIKLNVFAVTGVSTLCNSISGFTAQNAGAKDIERIKKGFKSGLVMAMSAALIFSALYILFGKTLVGIFMDPEETENTAAIAVGVEFLRIVAPFYILVSAKMVADAILKGTAAMREFMIATFTDLLIRVVFSFILAPRIGTYGIWLSWPIGWGIAAALSMAYYFMGRWKKKVIGESV